jgi:hypothetical protein
MKRRQRLTAFTVLALFIAIQFYQPKQGDRALGAQPGHIESVAYVPVPVKDLLQRSCYDCHSNATNYPWYSYVQPVGWWLESHISEGKEELNFSEFGSYSPRRQSSKLESVKGQLANGSMPPESYRSLHKDAQLSKAETQVLIDWVEALQDSLSQE